MTNSEDFKRKHNVAVSEGLSLEEIAKLSKMPVKALYEVFNRGVGAFKTNPKSVRPTVKSAEQWGYGRVYSFVMKKNTTFIGSDKDIRIKYKIK